MDEVGDFVLETTSERNVKIVVGGYEIEAHSEGGIETCFQVPAFDVCLDIGRCPPGAERRGTLLLTHAHIDHAAGLPYYVSLRSLLGMRPPTVYCPAESREKLQAILSLWAGLDADSDRVVLIGVSPGDEIPVRGGFARVFRAPHRIPAVGYTVWRRYRALKPELARTTRAEIARRARAGEPVSDVRDEPVLCYPGDTRSEVFDLEPSVTKARVLLLECTFVGPEVGVLRASRSGHLHLDEIADRASMFENQDVVLTHFSRRHSREEIERAVAERLPAGLGERIRLLIHRD